MQPTSLCNKYLSCSVPICPLDPDWNKRVMDDDEPVCFYLTEAVKAGAAEVFGRRGREQLLQSILPLIQPISSRWGRVKRQLERAKSSGSRMARLGVQHG